MTTPRGRLIQNRFAPSLVALVLACSSLATPAHAGLAGWLFGGDSSAPQKAQDTAKPVLNQPPAADIEGNVRQAHMLRLAGDYKQAIHHLAQLMLVASDNGRVVAEYGKTLAQMGRAQDAVSFLTRASQLRADDWTIFSALGVAYDELGEQDKAKDAYERALALKPNDPVVLNNYALSRLLAHDPQGAHDLAARARTAGGASNPKIERNLAMIADMAPSSQKDAATPQAQAVKKTATAAPKPAQGGFTVAAPVKAVPAADAQPQKQNQPTRTAAVADAPFVSLPVTQPTSAPIVKVQAPTPLPKIQASKAQPVQPALLQGGDKGVVMQKVPVDPLAGPVATHQPRKLAKADETKAKGPEEKTARDPEQIRDSVPALRLSANAY